MTDSITVYVRRGIEKSERIISFVPPAEFTQDELMEDGWALDGNQVLRSITISQLHITETKMADSFRQKGYKTIFC
jgi:hypothetical protein